MLGRTTLALALFLIGAVAAAAQSGGTRNLVFTVKDLVFKVEDLMRVRETPIISEPSSKSRKRSATPRNISTAAWP